MSRLIMAVILFVAEMGLGTDASARPSVTIVLDELPSPPPMIELRTNDIRDEELFYNAIDLWIASASDMITPLRNSVRQAVYVRTDFKCSVATHAQKQMWTNTPNILAATKRHLSQAIARILDRDMTALVPSRIEVLVNHEAPFACQAKLREWGTPFIHARPIHDRRNSSERSRRSPNPGAQVPPDDR